jgi:hypothetical protein
VNLSQADDRTPDEVRDDIDRILSRPEFRDESGESILERATNAFWKWVKGLFENLFGSGAQSVVTLLIFVVLGLAVLFIVRAIAGRVPRTPASAFDMVPSRPEANSTEQDWLARSAEHEAAGEWAEAVRCRHRATVAALGHDGRLEDLPSLTSGEVERNISAVAPHMAETAEVFTDRFEAVWYGGRQATERDVAATRVDGEQLQQPWCRSRSRK